jgi:hypothetical protein
MNDNPCVVSRALTFPLYSTLHFQAHFYVEERL